MNYFGQKNQTCNNATYEKISCKFRGEVIDLTSGCSDISDLGTRRDNTRKIIIAAYALWPNFVLQLKVNIY